MQAIVKRLDPQMLLHGLFGVFLEVLGQSFPRPLTDFGGRDGVPDLDYVDAEGVAVITAFTSSPLLLACVGVRFRPHVGSA